jgi:hypothetical protein
MIRLVSVPSVLVLAIGLFVGVAPANEIGIQVSPSTVNLQYEGTVVTVHADIPYRGVITATLELNGVPVWWTKADARGDLVAKFDVDRVKSIISPPSANLKLTGFVEASDDGEPLPFFGEDTIKVIDQSGNR